jgi:putative SOS response-associated peptidase YedK
MCTRFYLEQNAPEFNSIFDKVLSSVLADRVTHILVKPIKTSGEIYPTDIVPVIASNRKGEKSEFPMKWGFTLPNSKTPVVNARTETASVKPLFMDAWKRRRCIIPASWYYEWEHFTSLTGKVKTGDKFAIQPCSSTVTWLCGLYRIEDGFPVFTILTREPSEELRKIHDRMPLILPGEKIEEWIHPDSKPEEIISYALTDMVAEKELYK